MTKTEKQQHDQKLINAYNRQLEETEKGIANPLNNLFIVMRLEQRKNTILNRLMKLYGTEEYALVQ